MLASYKLKLLDRNKNVISERPFFELVNEIFDCKEGYEIEKKEASMPLVHWLPIRIRGETIRVEGEMFVCDILRIILDVGKPNADIENWVWLFIEKDWVIDDPDPQLYHFFICKGEEILREEAIVSNVPDNLLKKKEDFFFDKDEEYLMARVRMWYENFFKNSKFGKLVMSKLKNERDTELLGMISPTIEDFASPTVPAKINSVLMDLKELKYIGYIIIGALLAIVAILIFKK
jgi:hypothetical protein